MLDATVPELPADRPRYLMGVGRPEDLLEAIAPRHRPVRLRHAHAKRPQLRWRSPTRGRCGCETPNTSATSARWKRAVRARPAVAAGATSATCSWPAKCLGPILLSIHNLTYYQRLLADARAAIEADRFEDFFAENLRNWEPQNLHE